MERFAKQTSRIHGARFAKQTSRIHETEFQFMMQCLHCKRHQFILQRRHSEQMKVLLVPLVTVRGISLPQSRDQGALTEKQKRYGAPFKHLKGYYRRNSDPSRQRQAARVKRFGAQDDEGG